MVATTAASSPTMLRGIGPPVRRASPARIYPSDQMWTVHHTIPQSAQVTAACAYRLRSRECASLGATLGATGANDFPVIRTAMNNGQGRSRGHELI
jgi:hypothetical protein